MKGKRPATAATLAAVAVVAAVAAAAWWLKPPPESESQWALVQDYCIDCHNNAEFSGDVSFEGLTAGDIASHAETFETAVRKLRGDLMPPPGNPRPDRDQMEGLIRWLEGSLDASFDEMAGMPRAAHVPLQRMSRREYAATVRDLLAVDIDPAEYLPTDMEIDGFTNMAEALSVSPAFLEQYVSVARAVARIAVGQNAPKLASSFYEPPRTTASQDYHEENLPPGTRGGMSFVHNFPADGEYRLSMADLDFGVYPRGLETEQTLVMLIDRVEVFRRQLGGMDDLMLVNREGAAGRAELMAGFTNIPIHVTAGDHEVVITFIERSRAATDTHIYGFQPYGGFSYSNTLRVPRVVGGIQVMGPYSQSGLSRTASREKIFVCIPEVAERERGCAREIAANLAQRAYRRPVSADDLDVLMPYYEAGRADDGDFDQGIEHLVAAILVSPDFLYRGIAPPSDADIDEGAEFPLSDTELATRLSYFLWSHGPDSELLELAMNGLLAEDDVLDAQVERMLQDASAGALVDGFAKQWLRLDDLDAVQPDDANFPDFTEELRDDFSREATLFLSSILLGDRGIRDLLTADHTFVNERLADHYGIDGVYGSQFREVTLDDPARFGLLGKAAVLLRTSYGDRTSPVLRGAWVLEKLMGTPPAPPPADVETDLSTPEGEQPKTIRVRLEQHRASPNCNGCHGVIDPYGIALENFTVLGEWRDEDRIASAPIDASTVLPNGTALTGPIELRNAVLAREDQFIQAFTEKLMMYALGRELEYHDMRQIRGIVRDAENENYTLTAIVKGIVASDAFRLQARPREE